MLFDGNVVRIYHLGILSYMQQCHVTIYMVPLLIISGRFDVISKKNHHHSAPVIDWIIYLANIVNQRNCSITISKIVEKYSIK